MWRNYAGTFVPKRANNSKELVNPLECTESDISSTNNLDLFNSSNKAYSSKNISSYNIDKKPIKNKKQIYNSIEQFHNNNNNNNKKNIDLRLGSGQSIRTIEKINQSLIRVNSSEQIKNKRGGDSLTKNFRPSTHSSSLFSILSATTTTTGIKQKTNNQKSFIKKKEQENHNKSPIISGIFVRKRSSLPPPIDGDNNIYLSNSSLLNDSTLNLCEEQQYEKQEEEEEKLQNTMNMASQKKFMDTIPSTKTFTQIKSKSNMEKSKPNNRSETNLAKITNLSMFDVSNRSERPAPEMPSTQGIEYPRAASWSSSTVAEILRDPIGRQLFRCFLFNALAEENLLFVEEVEKLRKERDPLKIKLGISELLDKYSSYINLSSVSMSKLKNAANSPDNPDPKALELAHKEISKLLENDQFPRFRRSQIYLGYIEKLLPRVYAEKWATSFDALLGNQVGRHYFRDYLISVHAEENLRFWESVVEFRDQKNKSNAMLNMAQNIQQQYLREGAQNEVFLPFGLRQKIEKRIREKNVGETLFDDAVKHVEQILKNDPYVRFLQSKEYHQLLQKLN